MNFLFVLSCLVFTKTFAQNDAAPYVAVSSANTTSSHAPFWLEEMKHQCVVAFRENSTYQVFRNVKDFGAKGSSLCALNLSMSAKPPKGMEYMMILRPSTSRSKAEVVVDLDHANH
jgi:hypothetical protein